MHNKLIDLAYRISSDAHRGQLDKAGKPYIEHPLRVSNSVNSEIAKIVALLHDVVEDTNITFEYLIHNGIPLEAVDILKLLTRTKDITYKKYIEKIGTNEIAIEVKLADLKDNMNLNRIPNVTDRDIKRVETRYKPAYRYLEQRLYEIRLENNQ